MGTDGRIVDWAIYGQHIPLKCKTCGACFHTKNISPIGARTVFADEVTDCAHPASDLVPDEERFSGELV